MFFPHSFLSPLLRVILLSLVLILFPGRVILAQFAGEDPTSLQDGLNQVLTDIVSTDPALLGLEETSISAVIISGVNWLLSLVAVVALAVLVWGGFSYITSLGDEKKTAAAKKMILFAIIGVLVVGASFLIISQLQILLTGE